MLHPRCECASGDTRITFAPIGSAPQACFSVPAVSIQSSDEHDVGVAQQLLACVAEERRRRDRVQRVIRRECRAALEVGHDLRVQFLGDRDAILPVAFGAARRGRPE